MSDSKSKKPSSKLKKCPCCGGDPYYVWDYSRYGKYAVIECGVCGLRTRGFSYYGSENDVDTHDPGFKRAKIVWNTRYDEREEEEQWQNVECLHGR